MKKDRLSTRILLFSAMILSGSGVLLYADSALMDGESREQSAAGASKNKKQTIGAKRDYTVKKINRDEITIELGKKHKSVYLLFTNHGEEATTPSVNLISEDGVETGSARGIAFGIERRAPKAEKGKMDKPLRFANPHRPPQMKKLDEEIREMLRTKSKSLSTRAMGVEAEPAAMSLQAEQTTVEGDARVFNFIGMTEAHAKKVISDVETPMGTKSLVVWVSDNSFGEGCEKSRCVTQEMVDALAPKFLQSGNDNDIYEWVTAIYGEEWGEEALQYNAEVIPPTDEIHILLTDILEDDQPDHGYIGMYGSKDLFKKSTVSSSNEETMFYIDAVMFANGSEEEWSIDDPMPMEIVSTLIHEFTHMIEFYQKVLMLTDGKHPESWISEMLALATEDVVAVNARTHGPRVVSSDRGDAGDPGISWGRYPYFNNHNTLPVTTMQYGWASYCTASAFGTYLTRNFGGAKLLHDIMHNSYTDKRAVEEAVNKNRRWRKRDLTMDQLIKKWGVAVLLSDRENLHQKRLRYNIGDYFYKSYNGIDFLQGSINFYNYDPQPETFTQMQPIEPDANFYYKIGDDLSGDVEFSISKESDMDATVIIK